MRSGGGVDEIDTFGHGEEDYPDFWACHRANRGGVVGCTGGKSITAPMRRADLLGRSSVITVDRQSCTSSASRMATSGGRWRCGDTMGDQVLAC